MITRLLAWLGSPCLFGHADRMWERIAPGVLALVCPRCGAAHIPRLTKGAGPCS
jgi:hypothetical protein